MKRLLLSLSSVCISLGFYGQVSCTVLSPDDIAGDYQHSWAAPGNDWSTPDFNVKGVFVQDTLIMVDDGTGDDLDEYGHPSKQTACGNGPLVNAADVDGKIAVIYRGGCEFGAKAKKAQDAGAVGVIIVNYIPEVMAMGGGAEGANDTIPVVMLPSNTGDAIIARIEDTSVVMFMGNKLDLYGNDVGAPQDYFLSANRGTSNLTVDDHSFDIGCKVFNYGSENQDSVYVHATVTDPSSAVVYDETVGPLAILSEDSVEVLPGMNNNFPAFSLSSYTAGDYELSYNIYLADTSDTAVLDNSFSQDFSYADDIFSNARFDHANGVPIANSYPSNSDGDYYSCIFYEHPEIAVSGVAGLYFSAAADTAENVELFGQDVDIVAFSWDNEWQTIDDATYGIDDRSELTTGTYVFEEEGLDSTMVYAPFDNAIALENDQKYLFCVKTGIKGISFGYDRDMYYGGRLTVQRRPFGPILTTSEGSSTWYYAGWSGYAGSSIGVKLIPAESVSVSEIAGEANINVYPNPANDKVTISTADANSAAIEIVDLTGKTVVSQSLNLTNQSATVAIDQLKSGIYILNVVLDNGQAAKVQLVKN